MNKMHKEHNLTKNQKIIFDLIDKSSQPLKAYSILYNVQKKGIKAPLQVYRALDKLVEIGKIHKIESRNAFIACHNSSCQVAKATAFSICEICEKVTEISSAGLSKYLANFKDRDGMKYSKCNLEFFGLCKNVHLNKIISLMIFFTLNIVLAAIIITFASWLSGQNPKLAGFIISLPLV